MLKLSETAQKALHGAMVKRGPRKGLLLASAPKGGTLANAAWQAAMLNVNPFKVSIVAQMFFRPEEKAVFDEVMACWDSLPENVQAVLKYGLDKDRRALEDLGVW
ncbi:hypothetical protein UFOVP155_57 [uncultured Caudovirales phage]|uniref:Uncharacterized protein n=1 Tax=uncultured Caudovirales phage TaxID=2100421 RepID=A0A6J7WA29_9CAUD|nr:hypothetical protein UFOVP155_57 [uncultured Caudovirales phage]